MQTSRKPLKSKSFKVCHKILFSLTLLNQQYTTITSNLRKCQKYYIAPCLKLQVRSLVSCYLFKIVTKAPKSIIGVIRRYILLKLQNSCLIPTTIRTIWQCKKSGLTVMIILNIDLTNVLRPKVCLLQKNQFQYLTGRVS